jgi:hypothetical protein
VPVGQRQRRPAVPDQDGWRALEGGHGDAGQDGRCLVGQPDGRQAANRGGEPLPVLCRDVGEHGGVIHDEGRTGRGAGCQRGQVGQQVTAMDHGRVAAGGGDGGGEPLVAVAFAGPDQAGQPADVIVAADVQRIEVKPGPPGDHGRPVRQRHRPVRHAPQGGRLRVLAGDPVPGVVVGVTVGQQGESGAGADLDQRQRLRQPGQRRQQRGTAGGLVGLRSPGHHHGGQLIAVAADQRPQPGDSGGLAQQVAGRREQQVGLALLRRQRAEETQYGGVTGDRRGQCLIGRAAVAGILGECPVVLRGAHRQVMTVHRHVPNASGR